MSDNIAIKAENISKVFKLYNCPLDRFKESLHPLRKQYHHEFYALNNVSVTIKKGESVCIIGKNGSGKSTLLKILTGVLTPNYGTVQVNGKLSALLELGSGFNPELSGIENVYFNGMLMGYSRAEMDECLDDILSFADIGEFVHQPVKAYSSGMFVRLAFAVAVNVAPEILIVDEALSVGDLFFQQKCFARMKKILDSGITLLFVSHDLSGAQKLCKRGLLLKDGKLLYDGSSIGCVSAYTFRNKKSFVANDYDDVTVFNLHQEDTVKNEEYEHNLLSGSCLHQGDKGLEIVSVKLIDSDNGQIEYGKSAEIFVFVKANQTVKCPVVGFGLLDRLNNLVFSTNTHLLGYDLKPMRTNDQISISFKVGFTVQPGTYSLSVGCTEMNPMDESDIYIHHRCIGLGPITISSDLGLPPFYGIALLPCEVSLVEEE